MTQPHLIAIDWGTSSLRGFLIDNGGKILETRASRHGIQNLPAAGKEGFEQAFIALCADWVTQYKILNAVTCGMVGSAQGWVETPYVACPAGTDTLLAHATAVEAPLGVRLLIAPGMKYLPEGGAPDVMRGEEIQIAGVFAIAPETRHDALIVLPGTHSKWARIRDGQVESFCTYMTGEIYDALSRHTILSRLLVSSNARSDDERRLAFEQGLSLARDGGVGDFAHQLFSVRTLGLFGRMPQDLLGEYLSGIVIAQEIISGIAKFGADNIRIVGEGALCRRYHDAIRFIGGTPPILHENTAPAGLFLFATTAGLTSQGGQEAGHLRTG